MTIQTQHRGKVYLIGAGPGAPELITVRARNLIDSADIVAYDALISPSLLATIPPTVTLLPIGYRGYGSSKLTYGLHPEVVQAALEGKIVVRLKSGDPFIFGRGAQECLSLNEASIPYEVVPGVTSSLGAAVYAGFPLTHRKYSSDVVFASGHDLRGGSPSNSKWETLAQTGGTIVIFMGAGKIPENCKRLIDNGRLPTTPAMYIAAATMGNQKIIEGTLKTLGNLTAHIDKKLQALIIVGDVVKTRKDFYWREKLPFHDKRIVTLRTRPQPSKIAQVLRELGGDVIEAPFVIPKTTFADSIPSSFTNKSDILFSDDFSVTSFMEIIAHHKFDIRDLPRKKLYTLHKKTTEKLGSFGLQSMVFSESDISSEHNITVFGKDTPAHIVKNKIKNIPHRYESIYSVKYQFPEIEPPVCDILIIPSQQALTLLSQSAWKSLLHSETKIYTMGETISEQLDPSLKPQTISTKDIYHFIDELKERESCLLKIKNKDS